MSINDTYLGTAKIPKMLVNIQAQDKSIMYKKFLSQICFVSIFGAMENFLHAVIACDCYVAICYLLSYMVIMNHYPCILIFWKTLTSLFLITQAGIFVLFIVYMCSF